MEVTTMSQAMQLHAQALKTGSQPHHTNYSKLFTFSALSPSGDLNYARLILNSLQSPNSYYWNTMLRAYSDTSDPFQSISLFLSMLLQQGQNTPPFPDKFTYPFVLKSCAKLKDTQMGKQVHSMICKVGFGSDLYVCNSLIHMYAKCNDLGYAYKVFDKMPERDVVSWTSIIDGLADNGRAVNAVRVFNEMMDNGVEPNDATIVSALRACAETGALEVGKRAHRIVEEQGLVSKANVSTALIDMYAKCGCVESARRVHDNVVDKDVCTWTAMIHGLANHGMSSEAVNLFEQMESSGVKPDERTMTAVLVACRNSGWVNDGLHYFINMKRKYGIRPNLQHYGCIVDLYARAGQLSEAEEFIKKMRIQPDAVLWRTLIWACKIHGDTERAERLMKEINVDFSDPSSCVLVSNIYASAGRWHDKAILRETMNRQGILKPPGSSKIEVDCNIHEFTAGDSSHIEAQYIFDKLDEIYERLREEGYKPELSEVLHEIDDEEKAFQLLHHSEKLAVALGLMKTKPGSRIRIVKNLRSCEDCHTFMKLISRIYDREIVVRDRIRFHHFKKGDCSCGDYWRTVFLPTKLGLHCQHGQIQNHHSIESPLYIVAGTLETESCQYRELNKSNAYLVTCIIKVGFSTRALLLQFIKQLSVFTSNMRIDGPSSCSFSKIMLRVADKNCSRHILSLADIPVVMRSMSIVPGEEVMEGFSVLHAKCSSFNKG